MKVRYSELFASFQGEATYTGMPSIWLRFFGCNLECAGFGQKNPCDPATYELPHQTMDLSKIQFMHELPVLTKGCDSAYSWSNRFKHLAYDSSPEELAENINRLAHEKLGLTDWRHPVTNKTAQLCFTGGEPMMQQKQMVAVVQALNVKMEDFIVPQVTIETNATKPLTKDFQGLIEGCSNLHFAMSPKLFNVSGEKDAVKMGIIESYCSVSDTACIKFVHNGSKEAWDELEKYEATMRHLPDWVEYYIMPVGADVESQQAGNIAEICDEAMLRGYRVSARVHTYIYGNKMGT